MSVAEHGLKTIPLAVRDSDNLKWVEREFGLKGFGIAIKLIQEIADHGYYMKWDIDAQLSFVDERKLTLEGLKLVSEVAACCLRRGVFNVDLFKEYEILTNSDLQETFLIANKRRKEVRFVEEYALPIVYRIIENASKNKENVNISFKNVSNSEQIKLNKIKLNQTKEDVGARASEECLYGIHNNVSLPDKTFSKLGEVMTDKFRDDYIDRLSGFIKTKAKGFAGDHAATILKWYQQDLRDKKITPPVTKSYTTEQLNKMFDCLHYDDL